MRSPIRSRWLFPLLLCGISPFSLLAQSPCMEFTLPSIPFPAAYSISAPNGAGDRLVVGTLNPTYFYSIPLPNAINQKFCAMQELAPGLFAEAYVPTAPERAGDFHEFVGLLLDPLNNGLPFPGGNIPMSRLGNPNAWRIVGSSVTYCTYAISTASLGVTAAGGAVALSIKTGSNCPWSLAGMPGWMTVSGSSGGTSLGEAALASSLQGTGPANVTLLAEANPGGLRTGTVTVAGVSVPIRQLDGAACGGSSSCALRALPHLAYGGQWTTALSAISSGAAAASFSASFYGDAGTSLALPFTGGLGNLSTLTGAVPAGGMRYYEAENSSVGDLSGWALVTADENLTAQATYRRRTTTGLFYEAAVPSSGGYSRFVMPFDVGTFAPNGAQLFAAFAVVNLNPSASAHFVCTARSDSGVLIPNAVSIPSLAPLGHYTAFNFPLLTGRGTIDCSSDTLVSAIGLRAIGGDAISTLPVIVK
jgi:hypothetical protein